MKTAYKIVPYFAFGILPVLLLTIRAGSELLADSSILNGIFSLRREGLLMLKTVIFSVLVSAAATLIGVLATAFICGHGRVLLNRLKWIVFLSLPVPGCIHALAWLKWNGVVNKTGIIHVLSRGWIMSWFVQTMALLPIAVLITAGGVLLINMDQIRAAQLLGSDTGILKKILPGYLKPQIIASLIIVLLLAINDYAIPSIFSVNVYSLEIFVEYSSSLSMTRTLVKSLPLALLGVMLLFFLPGLLSETFLSGKRGELAGIKLKPAAGYNIIAYIAFVIIIIQFAVPVSVLLLNRDMWSSLGTTLAGSSGDLGSSLGICFLAVILGLPVVYLTADWLNGLKNLKTGLFIVLLPAILPASLAGTALINMFNSRHTSFIYDSMLMPVLAIMARFIPYGSLVVLAEMKRIDKSMLNAARILDRSAVRTSFLVVIPILSTALVVGASLIFLFGLGELGATVMVLPPGLSTVTVRLYNYLHYGSSDMVLGISFVMMLVIALIYGAIKLVTRSVRHDRAG